MEVDFIIFLSSIFFVEHTLGLVSPSNCVQKRAPLKRVAIGNDQSSLLRLRYPKQIENSA